MAVTSLHLESAQATDRPAPIEAAAAIVGAGRPGDWADMSRMWRAARPFLSEQFPGHSYTFADVIEWHIGAMASGELLAKTVGD